MAKNKMAKRICAAILTAAVVMTGNASVLAVNAATSTVSYSQDSLFSDVYTDKSMYNPGATVQVHVSLRNNTGVNIQGGKIELQARYLNVECGDIVTAEYNLNNGSSTDMTLYWKAPNQDFRGYMLEIDAFDSNGQLVDSTGIGVDVSSSWVKFPRYGYLHEFGDGINTEEKIEQMNRYHINGIEYYDWHYRHHEPLPSWSTTNDPGTWDDWSGRQINGRTIKSYISEAKEKNMVSMAYDMIYAGTDDFFKNDSVTNTWKIRHRDTGEEFYFTMGDSPSGNGHLYFVNPLHTDWQNHLFAEVDRLINVMGFDGFHGDTVGDWGEMTDYYGFSLGKDANGNDIYSVLDTYTQFLNSCKASLPNGKYLSFNPVGAKGIQNVNVSNTDVLYTEFWPWDSNRYGDKYETYYTLVKEVEDSMNDSKAASFDGKGKSLVVKAYINYSTESGGYMNDPAVLLCDAVCFAAGGARIEVGNGDHMLHHEYYPNDTIPMSNQLKEDVKDMYDFAVAYENILRDGQYTTGNGVWVDGYSTSSYADSNTIWTYTRADSDHEILHLINLLGTDNGWRDEGRTKSTPRRAENVRVRYYNSREVNAVYLASPDMNDGRTQALDFIKGNDGKDYIEFVVPSLEYWDMIYMSSKAEGDLVPGAGIEALPEETFRMEAEHAELRSNGGKPATERNNAASGGVFVHDIGLEQGYAEFTVPNDAVYGNYKLRLAYSSATDGTVSIRVNGQEYTVDYRRSGDDWVFTNGNYIELTGVTFGAGDKIQISDARNDCWIWLDYVSAYLLEEQDKPETPDVPVIPDVPVDDDAAFTLEAEQGNLVSAGGNPTTERSNAASGGVFVHDIGLDQGRLKLTVPASAAYGRYTLKFAYSSATSGAINVKVNDKTYTVDYNRSGDDWIFTSGNYIELANVELRPGDVITINDARNNCWIWLDYVNAYLQEKLEESEEPETPVKPENPDVPDGTDTKFTIEAETGKLVSAGGNPVVENNNVASGGKFVHDIGLNQGRLELTVPDTMVSGNYTLQIAYSSATSGAINVKVNGTSYRVDYNRSSDDWNFTSGNYIQTNVALKPGDVISISDAYDNCWIWVDYVTAVLVQDQEDDSSSDDTSVPDESGVTEFTLEAEAGKLTAAGGNPVVESSAAASGGKFVHDIGASQGYVTMVAPENIKSGYYQLELYYSSGTNGQVRVTVGDREYTIDYDKTGDWTFKSDCVVYSGKIWVNKGDIIKVQDSRNNCYIWLDKIEASLFV